MPDLRYYQLRKKIYENAKVLKYEFPNIICSSAYISPYAKIGHGCVILNNAVVQMDQMLEMEFF